MVKKYLLYFLMVFLIGIIIQIIGVFVISDLGISQYKSFEIISVGLGKKGCLLSVDGVITHYSGISTKAVNTVGAGDSLFS